MPIRLMYKTQVTHATVVTALPFPISSFQNTVDKLIKKANLSLVVGTSSWREQFAEALSVSAGKDAEFNSHDIQTPLYFIQFFKKCLNDHLL